MEGTALHDLYRELQRIDPALRPGRLNVSVTPTGSVSGEAILSFGLVHDGWKISGKAVPQRGRLVIYEITIIPQSLAPGAEGTAGNETTIAEATPDGGISSDVLRSIRTGGVVQEILLDRKSLHALGELGDRLGQPINPEIDRWNATGVTEETKSARGRPPLTDGFFRTIAEQVLEAQAQGVAVRQFVADRQLATLDSAKRWVKEARVRGFLLSDGHGRRTFRPGRRIRS